MLEARTDRLRLRVPQPDDAAFAFALLTDPWTTAHNPSDALASPQEAHDLVARWRAQRTAGLGYWIVERLEDGLPIGVCGVKAVELDGRPVWNLLYRFAPAAWGRGYAREAAAEAIRAALDADPSRLVVARVRPANTASARVAAAVGLLRRPELDTTGDDGPDDVWATPDAPIRSTRTA